MGVQARVVLYASDEAAAQRGFDAAYAEIGRLEGLLSDYRPSSELSRVNAGAGSGEWTAVSADTERVLRAGQILSKETEGAFDMTVGPLVNLWKKARGIGRLPAEQEVVHARELVGSSKLRIEGGRAMLPRMGMRLDPGAIAKGDAAHMAVLAVERSGLRSVLVALAGDIAAGHPPPGEKGWRVDVKVDEREVGVVRLAHACVSTSGDTEQFVEVDGVRYSHVIDPRTGWGVTHRHAATVVAGDGATADALSTALTVMTWEEAKAFARGRAGVSVLLHSPGGETWVRDERSRIDVSESGKWKAEGGRRKAEGGRRKAEPRGGVNDASGVVCTVGVERRAAAERLATRGRIRRGWSRRRYRVRSGGRRR